MDKTADFFAAIRNGDAATVESLLARQPELASTRNQQGQSPVLAAVYSGRKEICDLLIAGGPALDFSEAAAAGKLDRLRELIEKNPELAKGYSPDGFPIVALAAVFGHLAVVRYLFEKGADVNAAATNGTGYTALTGSVTGGHQDIVAWLLQNGADANYRYGPGYTPLLAAAANGHMEIVKALLDHGADLRAKANDGNSAVTIAEERKRPEIAAFLRGRGAE